jgi:hypothetical protein
MKHYFWILLLFATFFVACSMQEPTSNPSALIPLKEGNQWIYETDYYDSNNVLTMKVIDTIFFRSPINHGSENWYELYSRRYSDSTDDTIFYFNRPNGTWTYSHFAAIESLLYKYPTVAGDTFNTVTSKPISNSYPISNLFMETLSTNDTISLPIGIFPCIHYRLHEQYLDRSTMSVKYDYVHSDYFVSPGIGSIKLFTDPSIRTGVLPDSNRTSHPRIETILLQYTLK